MHWAPYASRTLAMPCNSSASLFACARFSLNRVNTGTILAMNMSRAALTLSANGDFGHALNVLGGSRKGFWVFEILEANDVDDVTLVSHRPVNSVLVL
jgi:hypothetical protein